MPDKYWFLKHCDLFERLTPDRLKQVEMRCRTRTFAAKSPIYLPADQSDAVLMLASGRVKICSFTYDGKQSILTFIEPGELFGELAILESGEREEYAEAVTNSSVILIPADEIRKVIEEYPTVSLGVTKLIGMRRRRIERRLKYLLFHSNRDRLANLLLELAEQYGKPCPSGVDLGIKLSHQDLANIIGSTRETVTLMLGELQNEGLISTGRRKVTLTNIEQLAASVNVRVPTVNQERPATKNSTSDPLSTGTNKLPNVT